MQSSSDLECCELICIIVNFGVGSKVLKIAKQNGITGGTVILGKGTVESHLLKLLELCDVRKEIVLMIAAKSISTVALQKINKTLKLHKPNHGIAFTTPVSAFLGAGDYAFNTNSGGIDQGMYSVVFVVVDKGNGENVMDAAKEVGAQGGTIINARGSGIHETGKLLNMEIEPEKEVVLIITDNRQTKDIVTNIRDKLDIDKPGKGIIFVQPTNQVYGINK